MKYNMDTVSIKGVIKSPIKIQNGNHKGTTTGAFRKGGIVRGKRGYV